MATKKPQTPETAAATPKAKIAITPELVAEHGFKGDEYERVLEILGREPSIVELGVFSVMWSEHCSYKSSRVHLKRLPTTGKRVVIGPGENAGVVDFDDGDVVVFKMESHNHPSYIEPYQGAATGVGGIMRDVFTMGARPVANLNALRFGDPKHPKTRHLVSGVVSGIGGYGNCVGVPTVGGETNFDPGYNGNIHRPNYLKVAWGTLTVKRCVLKSASIAYKVFDSHGVPLRAVVTASFTDSSDDKTRVAMAQDHSADLTHVRVVKAGETLPWLCAEIYGDSRHYIAVARVNGLDDFRHLAPGTRLFFPPIEK